ncbi:MAG: ABC transporter ATP-binding protein, partial [Acidimicrobiales bacterium]
MSEVHPDPQVPQVPGPETQVPQVPGPETEAPVPEAARPEAAVPEAALSIKGLSAGYGEADVIRDVDLEVAPGEIVALLGPNGAGKTTTLRVVSGLIKPSKGTVSAKGKDLARLSSAQRARAGIAHVPEGRGIFFGLTVAEHIRLGYRGEQVDPEVVYSYFPALKELKDRPAGLCSGGEQQMLAVARNLARNPELLLLDELSLGLAPLIVERLLPVVRDYARDQRCGVLLVEQHVPLALEVADTCYVLSHGDIVLHEPAATVRENQDLLVASYLGENQ